MTVIGLTGGIASGKSTAAAWLKEFGAVVIDADRLGHRVYEPGTSGFEAVVNEFGHDLVAADGTINRQLLGGKVFGRPDQMKRLTDIVWPEIRRLAREEVTELKRRDRKGHIVLEAAVLVEANWFDLVDEVWVVTVEPEVARARLMARNSLTEAQAQSRIDSQLTNKERSLHAYAKIDNSGTLDEFRQKVEREWKKLLKRTGTEPAPAPKSSTPPASAATRSAAAKASAKPATKSAAAKTPAAKSTAAKPAAKAAAKPAAKAATKPAAKPAAKPVAKATKPAAKAVKPAAKAVAKTTKPAVKAVKPAAKAVAKTTKPAVKAVKPAAKAVAKTTKPAVKAAKPAAKAATTTKTAAKAAKPAARRGVR